MHELETAILLQLCTLNGGACDPNVIIPTANCWTCRSQQDRESAMVRLLCSATSTAVCTPEALIDPYWVGRPEQERMSALVSLFCQWAVSGCDPSILSSATAACWLCRSETERWSAMVQLLCTKVGGGCDPAVLVEPCWDCRSSAERQAAMISMLCTFLETPPPPSTLLTGLTSYWKMDEISNATRFDSVGPNNLVGVNGPNFTAGKIGNAAQFVAASVQRLTAASNAGLQVGNNDRTAAFWVKLTDKAAIYRLVGKTDGSQAGTEWSTLYRNSTDRFEVGWTQAAPVSTQVAVANNFGPPTAGVWYLIICWHDSTTDLGLITVNAGTPNSVIVTGGCQALATSFDIGAESDGGLPANAVIDEVGWWSRVLTSTERTTLYNGGAGTTWPFTGMP